MKFFAIAPYYLYWHYTKGLKNLNYNFVSLLIFEYHFFSIKTLFVTLFQPFQRVHESYSGNMLDIEGFFSSLLVNIVMRVIGFIMRVCIVGTGLFTLFVTAIFYPFIILAWLVLPLALVFFLILSIWSFITHK